MLPYEAMFDSVVPAEDFCANVLNDPLMVVRQQLPSPQLLHLLKGSKAATQRVQYCGGFSPHASDSRSASVTRAAGAEAGNKVPAGPDGFGKAAVA